MEVIIQLIAGAIGGNAAGAAMKDKSLGMVGNTIAGLVGGGIGGQLLSTVLGGGGMDIGSIISQVVGSGVGGGAVMMIVGVVKKMMAK